MTAASFRVPARVLTLYERVAFCVGHHLRHFSDNSTDPDLACFDRICADAVSREVIFMVRWKFPFHRKTADLAGTLRSTAPTLRGIFAVDFVNANDRLIREHSV
jgi:hypothetical protein